MKHLQHSGTDPHFNMAFDEFALSSLALEVPVFFLWQNRPSVIIGLNQSAYAEVNLPFLEQEGITLARRVTGGGAVYHDLGNLNYSFTGRASRMNEDTCLNLIVDSLRAFGVPAERTGRNDILVEGRKCSGYAKRMEKDRIMVHGTLMFNVELETLTRALASPGSKLSAAGIASVRSRVANLKEYLPQFPSIREFQEALHARLAGADEEIRLTEEQLGAIRAQTETKFSTWEWNYGHSPSATFRPCKKFPCGTVEALFSLKHGCLDSLSFKGDFIGNLPADSLAARLEGIPYRLPDLETALQDAGQYFDHMQPRELALFLLNGE